MDMKWIKSVFVCLFFIYLFLSKQSQQGWFLFHYTAISDFCLDSWSLRTNMKIHVNIRNDENLIMKSEIGAISIGDIMPVNEPNVSAGLNVTYFDPV